MFLFLFWTDDTDHCLVAARHVVVVGQRKVVDEERADDDDGCGKGDAVEDTSADDRLVFLPWRLAHHVVVDGVDSE